MATSLEKPFDLGRAEMVARVLKIQAEAYGYLDIPILLRELHRYNGGNVLDVGTGDGSFLFKLAETNSSINYLGVEPNAELLIKAKSRLRKMRLPNVQLKHAVFDSGYKEKHDVILARFTLQHTRNPREFVQNAYTSLKPGGCFLCIEPVYDYYDCEPPQKIWQEFREKMLATYEQWKSHPNIPKEVCQWLSGCGFESISVSINLYSSITIGRDRFNAVILATAGMLNFHHPDLWEASFLEKLEKWLQNLNGAPFISIAHVMAFKPNL
jgi:SAM-dependent methyltransferase